MQGWLPLVKGINVSSEKQSTSEMTQRLFTLKKKKKMMISKLVNCAGHLTRNLILATGKSKSILGGEVKVVNSEQKKK